jgi:C-terminal processing protease CtpA/Prc
MIGKITVAPLLAATIVAGFVTPVARGQEMSSLNRDRALEMLDVVSKDVRKHYYDPEFHGINWDARVAEARNRIKAQTNLGMAFAYVAWALDGLDDSHTFFLPPQRPVRHTYGFETAMVGDRCYVTRVRPGTDAEAKGLKPGDEVLAIEGHAPNREIMWKMDYRFRVLRPQPELRVALRDPAGQQREVVVTAKIVELSPITDLTGANSMDFWNVIRESESEEHRMRIRSNAVGDDVLVAKLPRFFFDLSEVDGLIDQARKHQGLILDLRDNPGGAIDTLKYLLGGLFDHEVKIGDRKGRKELKPEVAKPRGRSVFAGKLIVLVDSQSASASELFARIVQLEKRGVVIGDRSSGSVMEAKHHDYHLGTDTVVFFGASITESDLIMADGKSLEHNGVTPDELRLPTAADLAAGRDPVLAYAAASLGAKLTPENAGKMFPFEWPKE